MADALGQSHRMPAGAAGLVAGRPAKAIGGARSRTAWPLALALALAAAWPLSAYAVGPLLLPSLIAVAAAVAAIVRNPAWGVALALVLVPLLGMRAGAGGQDGGSAQPLQALLPALAFGLAAYTTILRRERGPLTAGAGRWLSLALVAFVAAAVASTLQAISPAASTNKLVLLLTGAGLFVATLQAARDRRDVRILVGGALTGLAVTSLYAIVQQLLGGGEHTFSAAGEAIARAQAAFEHPAGLGYYTAVLLPLAALVALTPQASGALRRLATVALVAGVPALVLSYSRSAVVALVVGAAVWVVLIRPRLVLPVAAAVAALAALALVTAPTTVQQRFDVQQGSEDVELRRDVWDAAAQIYSDHPALGAGVNNFPLAYARLPARPENSFHRSLPDAGAQVTPSNAHNGYLNVLAEQGLVGLLMLLALMAAAGIVLVAGSRLNDVVHRRIAIATGIGAATWALVNLGDTAMISEVLLILLALVAICARLPALDGEPAG